MWKSSWRLWICGGGGGGGRGTLKVVFAFVLTRLLVLLLVVVVVGVGVGGENLHWVKLWEVAEEEEEVEDSHWKVGGVWGRGGVAPVGLRTVWAQWRKKPQEKSWVFSFGCCWWVFMAEQVGRRR